MAPNSSTLAWKILRTQEPGRLQSMGLLRVGHDWVTSLSLFTFMHRRRKWQPSPMFLPWESQGQGAWWAAVYEVAQSQTWLKRLRSSSSRKTQVVFFLFVCLVIFIFEILYSVYFPVLLTLLPKSPLEDVSIPTTQFTSTILIKNPSQSLAQHLTHPTTLPCSPFSIVRAILPECRC